MQISTRKAAINVLHCSSRSF